MAFPGHPFPNPPVHFHLGTNPPPKTGKVTSERAWLESGPYTRSMQFTVHSQTLHPSRRQVNIAPTLTESLPKHLGALFPADFPSVKSARQGGGVPRPPPNRTINRKLILQRNQRLSPREVEAGQTKGDVHFIPLNLGSKGRTTHLFLLHFYIN